MQKRLNVILFNFYQLQVIYIVLMDFRALLLKFAKRGEFSNAFSTSKYALIKALCYYVIAVQTSEKSITHRSQTNNHKINYLYN